MIFSGKSRNRRGRKRGTNRRSTTRASHGNSLFPGFFKGRSRARNKRQIGDLRKHAFFGAAIFGLVVVPIAIFSWILSEKSNELACAPGTTPNRHLVVLIDGSQTLTRTQKRIFERFVISYDGLNRDQIKNGFGRQVPAGTQVSIFKMELGNVNAPTPVFDECRLPMQSDFAWYDHLYRGGIIADVEFSTKFFDKLRNVLDKTITGGNSERSPILETIKHIATSSHFGDRPVDLVLFSDLEQNTDSFSFYKTCSQQTAYKPTEPPVCPPEPIKPPCSVARDCNKTILKCTTSICVEDDICGKKPSCGNPVSFCLGTIFGPNPTPDCDCNYATAMEQFRSRCEAATRNCEVRASENLNQCLLKRNTLLAECAAEQKATLAQCRKEEKEHQETVRAHRDQCRSDFIDWKKTEDARRKSASRKSCGWPPEEAFAGYVKNHENHWFRVNPGESVFEKVKFVHLNNPASKQVISEDWVESFWRGYADKIGVSEIEYFREE